MRGEGQQPGILDEVGQEFRYPNGVIYNQACLEEPREVLERIYGLLDPRNSQMVELAEKSVAASQSPATRAQQQQQRLADLAEKMNDTCEVCGGLPSGLPPQVYDDKTECECPVCPECHEKRPDDDRVAAGMKCGPCAYGGG